MKVGTDGVLLGAWVNTGDASTILDVGTGTGLIALMLAQRSQAKITGIEIDESACIEATANVLNSPWPDQISIINTSFQEYTIHNKQQFDLIVSNPPFFTNSKLSTSSSLALAKHNYMLPLAELTRNSEKMLTAEGRLAVILSPESDGNFIKTAQKAGLELLRLTEIRPKTTKKIHRLLMEFSKKTLFPEKSILTIHRNDGRDYTEEYKNLTKEFYLNF